MVILFNTILSIPFYGNMKSHGDMKYQLYHHGIILTISIYNINYIVDWWWYGNINYITHHQLPHDYVTHRSKWSKRSKVLRWGGSPLQRHARRLRQALRHGGAGGYRAGEGKKSTTGRFRDRIFGENWDSMGCFGDFSGISGGKELMSGYLGDTRSCSWERGWDI